MSSNFAVLRSALVIGHLVRPPQLARLDIVRDRPIRQELPPLGILPDSAHWPPEADIAPLRAHQAELSRAEVSADARANWFPLPLT